MKRRRRRWRASGCSPPRERQARRFAGHERVRVNAEMGPAEARNYCEVDSAVQPLLRAAARAFHRVLKLARTIADLAGAEQIAAPLDT